MSKNKEKMINGLKKLKRDEPTPEKSQPSGKNSREKTNLLQQKLQEDLGQLVIGVDKSKLTSENSEKKRKDSFLDDEDVLLALSAILNNDSEKE